VAIADRDGTVHFLYCVNYKRCFYLRSTDDGKTFSAPVEISAAFDPLHATTLATGPGHGIELRRGRLLVPIWITRPQAGGQVRHEAGTLYSDDHGQTWNAGAIAVPNAGPFIQPNECAVAELSDGRVLLNARSNSKELRRIVAVSPDGATNWSPPKFDAALWESICMAGLTTVPGHPKVVLFANPWNIKKEATGRIARRNLEIHLSSDDGQTWSQARVLEPASSGYSDLAALADGTVYCFYERSKSLTFARFNLDWLTSGPSS
jgi:sialidase-1